MNGEETQGNISHLTGMMGFIHRSGALAPFQVMMIITGTIFALAAYRQETAFEQPLCFWVLCLLAIEVAMALIIGLILACRRPDCLMSEKYQQKIKEMDAAQKGMVVNANLGDDDDSSDESDDRSVEG